MRGAGTRDALAGNVVGGELEPAELLTEVGLAGMFGVARPSSSGRRPGADH